MILPCLIFLVFQDWMGTEDALKNPNKALPDIDLSASKKIAEASD